MPFKNMDIKMIENEGFNVNIQYGSPTRVNESTKVFRLGSLVPIDAKIKDPIKAPAP